MGTEHTVTLTWGFILNDENVKRIFKAIEKTRKKQGKPPIFSDDDEDLSQVHINELFEHYFAIESTKFSVSLDSDEDEEPATATVTVFYTNGIGSIERWGNDCKFLDGIRGAVDVDRFFFISWDARSWNG